MPRGLLMWILDFPFQTVPVINLSVKTNKIFVYQQVKEIFNVYKLQVPHTFQYSFIDERLVLSFQNKTVVKIVEQFHDKYSKNESTLWVHIRHSVPPYTIALRSLGSRRRAAAHHKNPIRILHHSRTDQLCNSGKYKYRKCTLHADKQMRVNVNPCPNRIVAVPPVSRSDAQFY